MKIKISSDYAKSPGPRLIAEGKNSGEEFRKKILLPKLKEAIERSIRLEIDLDGTAGYGTSFLEESFGGLIREDGFDLQKLRDVFIFKSVEEPGLLDEINEYLEEAEMESKGKK